MWFNKTNTHKQVKKLVEESEKRAFIGINWKSVREDLEIQEYELVIDTIATQIYEFHSEIDEDFYKQICDVSNLLGFKNSEYFFLKELIRNKNKIPQPIKDKVGNIILNLLVNAKSVAKGY